jgi:glycosyltransferase involved in cell wall biosynthesis
LRILLVVHQFLPDHYGGTEQLTSHTGLELLARGHEVHVLTAGAGLGSESSAGVPSREYDYQGLKVHAVGAVRRRTRLERIRDEYANDLMAGHVRGYVERLQPEAIHIFNLFNLSGSLLDVFEELDVPVVFTPTSFWPINKTMLLIKPSGELCDGPDELSANCLECWGAEKYVKPKMLPQISDKREFYRALARRTLSEPQNTELRPIRLMLERNRYLQERFNRSVDAILSPNEFMSRKLTTHGIDPDLVRLSPYGMNTSGFETARTLRPESGELRVGFIGSINRPKGLHVLIEAFKQLPQESGVTLRVCGGLNGWPDYACEVYEMAGGDPRINFAGSFPNEEMVAELGKIDALVVPSVWHENTPLVVYSAFAAGIPVVASGTEGLSAIVHHGVNGLLFEPGNAGDLAAQLRRLLEEPELLEKLGSRASTTRSVEDSVDEMLDIYGRISSEKKRERVGGPS